LFAKKCCFGGLGHTELGSNLFLFNHLIRNEQEIWAEKVGFVRCGGMC
jgi:hypothetical protein